MKHTGSGGIIKFEDFQSYKSIIYKPSEVITTKLRNDFVICGPPPPSAGAVAQALISIMDSWDFQIRQFLVLSKNNFALTESSNHNIF